MNQTKTWKNTSVAAFPQTMAAVHRYSDLFSPRYYYVSFVLRRPQNGSERQAVL